MLELDAATWDEMFRTLREIVKGESHEQNKAN